MYSGKRESMIKGTLRSLCCSNGWCYGILWGFDQRNSLLLTSKHAYYEEQVGALIDNTLMQVHVLGEGVIGQAALTRNNRWMFSDALRERQKCLGSSSQSPEFLEDNSDLNAQFLMGIKTIALISVEPWGIVQLGSTRKVLESKEFIDQVKLVFRGMGEGHKLGLSESEPSSSDSHLINSGMQFNSMLSSHASGSAMENFQNCADSEGFIESNYLLSPPSQLFSSSLDHQNPNSNSLFTTSPMVENQAQTDCKFSSQLDQLFLESGSSFDCSVLTSSWSHLPSGSNSYECSTSSSALSSPALQAQELSKHMMTARDSTIFFHPTDSNTPRPSGLFTLDELFAGITFAEDLCKACPTDDFSQLFSPLQCSSNNSFSTILSNDQSQAAGIQVPKLSGQNSPIKVAENHSTNSMQSSVTNGFRPNSDNKFYDVSGIDRLLNGFGAEPGCEKPQSWNEPLLPVVNGADVDFNTSISACFAEKTFGSKPGTSNSLFSRLGLDQLLDGSASSSCSFAKSRLEDRSLSAAKRRKVDTCSWSQDPEVRNAIELKSDITSAKEPGLCVRDSSIIGAGSSSSSKRPHEPAKTGKKKAKPGTRPRPKDRQMIQDRLAELRGLIPNGEKMSIDRLLERTIRHMNFMGSLAKHSESLKQADKTKSRTVQKGHSSDDSGVTWACEVGDKSMVCPLIIEDLNAPGQMLIEILYEECGFFLEIVDIIRSFGLTIMKGVMEVRESKIWARFIVEAKGSRPGMRHEIFSSLIQLLQMTGGNPAKVNEHFGNNISSGVPLFNNYQSVASFHVNLADTIQCANL